MMIFRLPQGLARLPTLCLMAFLASTLLWVGQAHAQLKPGQTAPDFRATAALAGEVIEFDLKQALRKGPVVVYFYPKAFTSGCTIEAQLFAQATPDFQAQNTTVVGVSGDDIETLKKFSEGPCGGKFAVAADADRTIMKAYDAAMRVMPGMAARVSYAIAPDGTIIEAYDSMSPSEHVTRTLAAVTKWQSGQR